jgi:hypothetical protein
VCDRKPVGVRLPHGEVAVREIGQRDFEADLGSRPASAVVAMARGASGGVHGARLWRLRGSRGCAERERDKPDGEWMRAHEGLKFRVVSTTTRRSIVSPELWKKLLKSCG